MNSIRHQKHDVCAYLAQNKKDTNILSETEAGASANDTRKKKPVNEVWPATYYALTGEEETAMSKLIGKATMCSNYNEKVKTCGRSTKFPRQKIYQENWTLILLSLSEITERLEAENIERAAL